ncbi:MAG TPA: methyltransferase domain-containing protein [Kiritimatiellia bacterium]
MSDTEPKGITFQPDIYPKVLSLLPPKPARVLDVGAGEGYFCKLLKERGYEVEACDYQQELFKLPGVPFHKGDFNRSIPLPDNSYDCIVSIEVLEHLENHVQFMREVMRVLKPGGTVILTTPNVLSFPSRWHFFIYGYTDCAPRPLDPSLDAYYMQHINPISVPEILFLLERFGGEMTDLAANRTRRGAWFPLLFWYPVMALALRGKLLRSKYREHHDLYKRHIRWVLHPANMTGRITIAVGRKVAHRP